MWFYRKTINKIEGFQQKERFILKTGQASYDEFYSEIYDELWEPENRSKYEIDVLIKTLDPQPIFSNMLDVGCGTGSFLKELKKKGFQARGIDLSIDMTQRCINDGLTISVSNVLDPMIYERRTFTHIFCMDFTLYELEDKYQFFKNSYCWLKNNGYLIIHLADKTQFNPIIPAAKSSVIDSIEQLGPTRIVKTEIEFEDFVYTSDYITDRTTIVHTESFTDKTTQHIRQNERILKMDSPQEILKMAIISGFIVKGMFSMVDGPSRDAAQQIVILEKI